MGLSDCDGNDKLGRSRPERTNMSNVTMLGRVFEPRATWSNGLRCGWISWSVVDDGILRLDMPAAHCCDMRGAIEAAEALCPMVWRIDTYAGGAPDTTYVVRGSEWEAVDAVRVV
jgi:hypothetical protein